MFEEADSLSMSEIVDHESKYIYNGVEALVGMTNIGEPYFVEENFLNDENGDCFR